MRKLTAIVSLLVYSTGAFAETEPKQYCSDSFDEGRAYLYVQDMQHLFIKFAEQKGEPKPLEEGAIPPYPAYLRGRSPNDVGEARFVWVYDDRLFWNCEFDLATFLSKSGILPAAEPE